MIRSVLFTADERLARELETWVRPHQSRIRLDWFKTVRDFEQYRNVDVEGHRSAALERDIEAGGDAQMIQLIIFDADFSKGELETDLKSLQKTVRSMGLISVEPPRVMLLAHSGHEAHYVRGDSQHIDGVDDLVLKPIDRELFLQKVELLATDNPHFKASFLYEANTDMVVEIGKDVIIEEISEFAVTLRNPNPFKAGTLARLHTDLLGRDEASRVLARAYANSPDSQHPGQHHSKMSFFGIKQDQLSHVRKAVKTQFDALRSLKGTIDENQRGDARNLGFGPEKRIAVMDMDPDSLEHACELFESGFRDVRTIPFHSYSHFHQEVLNLIAREEGGEPAIDATQQPNDGAALVTAPVLALGTDDLTMVESKKAPAFPDGKITIVIEDRTLDLIRVGEATLKTLSASGPTFLGLDAKTWLSKPSLWIQTVERADRDVIEELTRYSLKGVKATSAFRIRDATGQLVYVQAKGLLEEASTPISAALIRLELEQITAETFREMTGGSGVGQFGVAKNGKGLSFFQFDAIFIDASLVRPSPEEWISALRGLMRKAGLIEADAEPPPIFVLCEEDQKVSPVDFKYRNFNDVISKPFDKRQVLLKLQALLAPLTLARDLDQPRFVKMESHAKLASELRMTELSEFGLAIVSRIPFREGVLMKFFSPLFGDHGGAWVTCRCRHAIKSETGDLFTCRFLFYGVSDDVLHRIRNWIREDYVAKKEVG